MISARVTERGQPVSRQDFLKLMQVELAVSDLNSEQSDVSPVPFDPELAFFGVKRAIDFPAGDYDFTVRVDGGTFRREKRSKLHVHAAPVTFSSSVGEDGQTLEISARAEPELVDLESLTGLVLVTKPDGSNDVFDLPPFASHEAILPVPAPLNGSYRIEPRLLGRGASGRVLTVQVPQLVAEITAGADPPAPAEEPKTVPAEPPRIDWLHSGALVLIGNVVVAASLGLVWLMLGQRRRVPSKQAVLQ